MAATTKNTTSRIVDENSPPPSPLPMRPLATGSSRKNNDVFVAPARVATPLGEEEKEQDPDEDEFEDVEEQLIYAESIYAEAVEVPDSPNPDDGALTIENAVLTAQNSLLMKSLEAAKKELDVARSSLDVARSTLSDRESSLEVSEKELDNTESKLSFSESERDTFQLRLETSQCDLRLAEESCSRAQSSERQAVELWSSRFYRAESDARLANERGAKLELRLATLEGRIWQATILDVSRQVEEEDEDEPSEQPSCMDNPFPEESDKFQIHSLFGCT